MSTQPFPLLFSPIRLGRMEVRNRIALPAHGTGLARESLPDERLINYYAERAKGGVGLIVVGSLQIHPTSPGITSLLCNYDESIIPGLRRVADAVHGNGAKVCAQLSHMGLASTARPVALWSASALSEQRYGEVAHAMTIDEIEEIIEAYAAAASRCMEAGLDGITVHAAHGLLVQQFMSPRSNKRTDAYGGSLEGRLRFPIEVLQRVRQSIGPDKPLGMRVSADEFVDGGLTLEDMREIVPRLVAAGQMDYVDVSAGHDGFPVSAMLHQPPMGISPANLAYLAAGIKEVVEVPVIHATRINSPELAEKLLQDGMTDMVGMVRALIADPHLPNKARAGRVEDINPCVACNQGCSGRLDRGKHITCIGNPVTGRETEWAALEPAAIRKKVVVVGGGAAGMESAIIAAKRGHEVVLFEKQDVLGGQVLIAAKAPTRDELSDIVRHRINQLKGLGVQVRTGVEATKDLVVQQRPDAVVIATGALPSLPDIPGADGPNVVTAWDVLSERVQVGERVLLVDYLGYERAATVALFLAERGKQVEIVTEGPYVGHRTDEITRTFLYQQMLDNGVILTPRMQVIAIEEGGVVLRNVFTGAQYTTEGIDNVVAVTPGRANDHLFHALKDLVGEIHVVGDCYTPRDLEAAILEGQRIGRQL